jgi:hypothetical protein
LQVQDEWTTLKLCTSAIKVEEEERKGSEILVAHIYSLNEGNNEQVTTYPNIQEVLEE